MTEGQPPRPRKKPHELVKFGDKRVDDYYWMNERENPEVLAHLESENNYLENAIEELADFRQILYNEMKQRVKERDMTVPYFENGYWYYTRYEEESEYPIECRKKGTMDAEEEILFDVNELSKGQEYFSLTNFEISSDNKIAAYCFDNLGRKQNTLLFKILENGELLQERIFPVSGDFAWAKDNKTLYYVVNDETTLRPCKIFKHKLGEDPDLDVLVYEERDETFEVSIDNTKSERFIVITSGSTLTTEQHLLPADKPLEDFKVVQPRVRGLEYYVDELNDELYIITNLDAVNFRLMKCSVYASGKENWKELVPHRPDVLLEDVELFKDFFVLEEHRNGLMQLNVMRYGNFSDNYIEFRDPAYMVSLAYNPQTDTNKFRYHYTSLTTPDTVFEMNVDTGETILLKQREVLGGFDPEDYTSERLEVKARDGVIVPLSIVYRKDLKKDGKNPLLIYGYGAYGVSNDPEFYSDRLTLLDRGFIFALAHVRGGQELGRQWYDNGRLLRKKNTFTDFIDCTEFLIKENYADRKKIFAEGMSAGGLLIGAITNMRPDLWNAVVAHVPFVDCVTTMLDESLPLTTGEYDEWGNPNEKAFYNCIRSYSPYDNIEKKSYPAVLATTSFQDSQVQYWEPAKWVAKLRDHNTNTNPILLQTEIFASHFGKSGRFESLKLVALEYAFLLNRAGIRN